MNWIELMGLSGVGKTTFLKSLVKYQGQERKWVITNEALIDLAKKKPVRNYAHILFKLYLKQNLVDSSKLDIAKILIDSKKDYLEEAIIFQAYFDSYLDYYYKHEVESSEKAYRISLYKSIVENICTWKQARYSKTVVMDEGLLNHHPNLFSHNWNETEIIPSGLIFCHLNAEEIFRRIKQREHIRGRPSPLHRQMTEEKLKKDIEAKLERFNEKRTKLISQNIPYMDVDLKQINDTTLERSTEFINTIKTEIV